VTEKERPQGDKKRRVNLRGVSPEGSDEALRFPFGLSPSGLRLRGDKKGEDPSLC